jgi:hypothetical protein
MNIDSAGGIDEFVVTLRYNSDLINGAFSEFYLFAKSSRLGGWGRSQSARMARVIGRYGKRRSAIARRSRLKTLDGVREEGLLSEHLQV